MKKAEYLNLAHVTHHQQFYAYAMQTHVDYQ